MKRVTLVVPQQVGRLDVPMHDARAVRFRQPLSHLRGAYLDSSVKRKNETEVQPVV